MKILFLGEKSDRPESHIIAGMAQKGHNVTWLGHIPHPQEELFKKSGVTIKENRYTSKLSIRAARRVRKEIIESKPDIVCAFTGKSVASLNLATIFLKNRPKKIVYRGVMTKLSNLDPTSFLTFLNPSIDAVMCVSKAVKEAFLDHSADEAKLFQIYKGHSLSWYARLEKSKLKEEFNIPDDYLVVGSVSNMRENKGVDTFIEASSYILENFKVKFLVVGTTQEEVVNRLLSKYPLAKERCIFAGSRKDSTELLGACDIAAQLPKWREGLPKTAIEAMIQGVPLVATRIGGLKELVIDGVTGIFVPPEDPESTARAIEKLATSPELRVLMGKAAQSRITTDFNIENSINQFEGMCKQII